MLAAASHPRRARDAERWQVFRQEACSLRFDRAKGGLVAAPEPRHPVYRLLAQLVAGGSFTMRRRLHTRSWLRAFCELLRADRLTRCGAAPCPHHALGTCVCCDVGKLL
jgi:homogentisate 1,2-dioxygenase